VKQQITPDKEKAVSLRKMAEVSLERLDSIDKTKYPSNTLKDYYDIIHMLMEAISIEQGVKLKGEGAHQQLIEYIAQEGIINEKERIFLQAMRDFRNRISYEGFMINETYISLNQSDIDIIIGKLKSKHSNLSEKNKTV
jgi:uncharacterized protein YutE (UPF0331/DUF86 family)